MKKRTIFLTFVLVFCTILSCIFPGSAKENGLELIAHRGYSSAAPENTLAAVKEAGMAGFYGCEFDIRITKDNVWVVMHDASLATMTDKTGRIPELTYDEIMDIRITKGSGIKSYPDEKIPTFVEMLDECAKWGLHPVIEIKDGSKTAIAELCETLNSRPEKARFTVISFTKSYITAVKSSLPDMKCLFLTENLKESDIQFALDEGLDGVSFSCENYDPKLVADALERDLSLNSWTVDDVETAKALYEDSVTSITTNTLDPSYTYDITGIEEPKEPKEKTFMEKLVEYLREILDRIRWLFRLK